MAAALSAIAVSLQHGYYRSTRDGMRAVAATFDIETWGVASTPGAHGERDNFIARIGKVQRILHMLLLTAATVDVIGMIYVLIQ